MTKLTAAFHFLSSTKGAHRYFECDLAGNKKDMRAPDCIVGTLYIRKSAMPDPIHLIMITIKGKE